MFIKVCTFATLVITIHLPIPTGLHFTTIDCYNSFSKPEIVLRLHHYNPSGPDSFIAEFELINDNPNKTLEANYFGRKLYFKKMGGDCKSNLMISSNKKYMAKIWIGVRISLSTLQYEMAFMSYHFHRGFKEDDYLLVDYRGNFALEVRVSQGKNQFLETLEIDMYKDKAHAYINSISNSNSEICVVTPNNRELIIKPFFPKIKPRGFITRINVKFNYINNDYRELRYDAFQCNTSKIFNNEPTLYIIENFPRSMFFISITYIKYMNDNIIEYDVPFFILDLYLIDYISSLSFPSKFKKIFFLKKITTVVTCPDNSEIQIYKSEFNTIYLAYRKIEIEVMPQVTKMSYIKINTERLCG